MKVAHHCENGLGLTVFLKCEFSSKSLGKLGHVKGGKG
jgi:hypothetical protein